MRRLDQVTLAYRSTSGVQDATSRNCGLLRGITWRLACLGLRKRFPLLSLPLGGQLLWVELTIRGLHSTGTNRVTEIGRFPLLPWSRITPLWHLPPRSFELNWRVGESLLGYTRRILLSSAIL